MIFALDTSTSRLSLALRGAGKTVAKSEQVTLRKHNETVLPVLQALLSSQSLAPDAITGIAVGLGPGSFTGVRVGIATAVGMAQALGIPVIGMSSYLAIAAGSKTSMALVVGDARQDMLYAACYAQKASGWEVVISERLVSLSELADMLPSGNISVSGPGAFQFYRRLTKSRQNLAQVPEELQLPDAAVIAQLADGTIPSFMHGRLQSGGMRFDEISPIYLRRTQAEEVRLQQQARRGT